MGFNSAFKGLKSRQLQSAVATQNTLLRLTHFSSRSYMKYRRKLKHFWYRCLNAEGEQSEDNNATGNLFCMYYVLFNQYDKVPSCSHIRFVV